jgi:hypothetical protein
MASYSWAANVKNAELQKNNLSMQSYIKNNLTKYNLIDPKLTDPDEIAKKFSD